MWAHVLAFTTHSKISLIQGYYNEWSVMASYSCRKQHMCIDHRNRPHYEVFRAQRNHWFCANLSYNWHDNITVEYIISIADALVFHFYCAMNKVLTYFTRGGFFVRWKYQHRGSLEKTSQMSRVSFGVVYGGLALTSIEWAPTFTNQTKPWMSSFYANFMTDKKQVNFTLWNEVEL